EPERPRARVLRDVHRGRRRLGLARVVERPPDRPAGAQGELLLHRRARLGLALDAPRRREPARAEREPLAQLRPAPVVVDVELDLDVAPAPRRVEEPDLL